MATTFFLVRHGAHGLLGRVLTGRMPHVHLAEVGRIQARQLARFFAAQEIAAVQSSPRERAEETARPIAEEVSVRCRVVDALDEIDFGAWTGLSFAELEGDPAWEAWNSSRGTTRPPGGESMAEVQVRLMTHLRQAHSAHPDGKVVLVSHGDVIKAAVLHVLGATFDAISALEISPAGVTTVLFGDWGGKLLSVNERVAP